MVVLRLYFGMKLTPVGVAVLATLEAAYDVAGNVDAPEGDDGPGYDGDGDVLEGAEVCV